MSRVVCGFITDPDPPSADQVSSVEAFCEDNADDPDLCERVRGLSPGEMLFGGGGAAPEFFVKRLTPQEAKMDPVTVVSLALTEATGKQPQSGLLPSKGHLLWEDAGEFGIIEWYERAGEIYRAHSTCAMDTDGYRFGRWEATAGTRAAEFFLARAREMEVER